MFLVIILKWMTKKYKFNKKNNEGEAQNPIQNDAL